MFNVNMELKSALTLWCHKCEAVLPYHSQLYIVGSSGSLWIHFLSESDMKRWIPISCMCIKYRVRKQNRRQKWQELHADSIFLPCFVCKQIFCFSTAHGGAHGGTGKTSIQTKPCCGIQCVLCKLPLHIHSPTVTV